MAVRPTTLALENLESRLNLSTVMGHAFAISPGHQSFIQDRAIFKGTSRLISLQSGSTNTSVSKALAAQALIAAADADSPAPDLMVSSTQKAITLTWQNNSTNETGFHIERSTDGQNFSIIANVAGTSTSYTDSKATLGTNYTYRVTAYNKSPDTAGSNAVSAALQLPPPPAMPTNFAATKATTSSITLSWKDNANNETGYRVYRSTDGVNFTLVANLKAGTKTFTDTKLTANTPYYYEVSAWNPGGATYAAAALSTATLMPAPTAPAGLALSGITSNSLNLNWSDTSQYVEGFRIYRSTNGGAYTLIGNAQAGTTTFSDSSLTAKTKYSYEVSAWNSSADLKSKSISATTLVAPPGAPTNLAFSDITTSGVTLSWTDTATTESGFHVYRSTDGATYSLDTTLAVNATSFSDTNLNSGTTYWYKVTAFNATGEMNTEGKSVTTAIPDTPVAAPVTVPPNAPANVTFSNITSSGLTVNWTESSTNAGGIHIYRSTDGTNYALVGNLAATATSWNDSNLLAGTQYDYKVAAWNSGGETSAAPAGTATLVAAPNSPTGVNFTNITTTGLTLNWSAPGGQSGIHIYRSTDGTNYTLVGNLAATATSWSDSNLLAGTQYDYKVAAWNSGGETSAAPVGTATLAAAPNSPTGVNFTNITTTGATLNWTAPGGQSGYHIYRSTDGTNYTVVGTLAANAVAWSDSGLTSNTMYFYEIGAYNAGGETRSIMDGVTTLAPAPNAPTGLSLTNVTSTGVTLNWTAPGNQTGYHIYRSTDGTNFTLVGTATAGANSWNDSGLASSTKYYYSVGAFDVAGETRSASANTTTAASVVMSTAPITISTQNMTSFNELVIQGTTGNDSIVVSQSGGVLNIVANGQSYIETNTFGDMKIYGVGGNDTITVNSSVNIATLIYGGNGNDVIQNLTTGKATIVTIGNGTNTVTGNGINTSFWVNTGDKVNASAAEIALGGVNRVASFYQPFSSSPTNPNYIPLSLQGQNLPDPTDSGTEERLTNSSFWGTGPSMNDINQTGLADCYFLAPLASLAYSEPQKLMNMAVDLGDGTYAVRFVRNGTTSYVRVDGDLSTGFWGYGLGNQTPGADGNEWGSVFEKAYAFFRSGQNTYASLNYGTQSQTYWDLGLSNSGIMPSFSTASAVMSTINTQLAAGHGVVASTNGSIAANVPIVESHVYTVIGAFTNSSGVTMIQMRNPWGVDGFNDDSNPSDGIVTVDFATFEANFNSLNYTLA